MCLKYLRFCSDCNRPFTFSNDANSCLVPILLFNKLCGKVECHRYLQPCFNLEYYGYNSCGSSVCSPSSCQVHFINLNCGKVKKNDWKYILKN